MLLPLCSWEQNKLTKCQNQERVSWICALTIFEPNKSFGYKLVNGNIMKERVKIVQEHELVRIVQLQKVILTPKPLRSVIFLVQVMSDISKQD